MGLMDNIKNFAVKNAAPKEEEYEYVFPTSLEYDESSGSSTIKMYGRTIDGRRVQKFIENFNPYFYAPLDLSFFKDNHPDIHDIEYYKTDGSHFLSIENTNVMKVYAKKPSRIGGHAKGTTYLRDLFTKSYEADIPYVDRARIDLNLNNFVRVPKSSIFSYTKIQYPTDEEIEAQKKLYPNFSLRIQIVDIENLDDKSIKDAKKGLADVVCFTVYDNYLDKYLVFTYLYMDDISKFIVQQKLKERWASNEKYKYMSDVSIEYFISPTKEEMMVEFIKFLRLNYPDIMAGWNFKDYDIPVLLTWSTNIGIDINSFSEAKKVSKYFNNETLSDSYKIRGLLVLDLMGMYDKIQPKALRFTNLNYISNIELGTQKLDKNSIIQLVNTDIPHLIAYNIVDVQLTKLIEEKAHLIEFFSLLSFKSFTEIGNTSNSQFIDKLLLKFVNNRFCVPTKVKVEKSDDDEDDDFIGGKVYDSTPGVHEYIIVLDYTGLYPSIMRSLNISIETKDPNGEIVAANGVHFRKSPRGVVPSILEMLLDERNHYKKLEKQAKIDGDDELEHIYNMKQIAVKILMNAFFGVLGWSEFRLNDTDTAEAITSTGQDLSMNTKAYVESLGFECIYGDTDSLFIRVGKIVTPEEAKTIATDLCSKVNKFLGEFAKEHYNIDSHYFNIDFDKYASVLFQPIKKTTKAGEAEKGAKKRYAGYFYNYAKQEFEFKAQGFELKRASSSVLTQEVQELLLRMILDRKSDKEIKAYLNQVKTDLLSGNVDQQKIGLRYNIKKEITDFDLHPDLIGNQNYMAKSKGLTGTLNANNPAILGRKYNIGDKVMLYNISEVPQGIPKINLLCIDYEEEMPEGFKIDYEQCWNSFIVEPTESVLKAIGIPFEYIETGIKTNDTMSMLIEGVKVKQVQLKQAKDTDRNKIKTKMKSNDVGNLFGDMT